MNRIPDWENEKALNKSAVLVSKNSARAHCFYAVSLYKEILALNEPDKKLPLIDEALKNIDISLKIYPQYADALKMKAALAAENYKIDNDVDKLLDVFREVQNVRHVPFVDEFTDWLVRRADKNKMVEYYFNVGYTIFAVDFRNFKLATNYLQKGYELNPQHKGILFGSCIVNYLTGSYPETVKFGQEYLHLYGDNADIYYYIGNAQVKTGRQESGLRFIEKAYELKPELKNKK